MILGLGMPVRLRGLEFRLSHLLEDYGGVDRLGSGEDVESELAAILGPLAVSFGQDCADEPDDARAIEEDPDDVGSPNGSRG